MLIELPDILHWKSAKNSKKGGITGGKFGPSLAPNYEKKHKHCHYHQASSYFEWSMQVK